MAKILLLVLLMMSGIAQATVGSASTLASPHAININTATAAEIDAALVNIGPQRAKRIVEYRGYHGPFKHPEDVMEVPYIGPRLFKANQGYIRVN